MSNFKLGFPSIQINSTATANLTASTSRPFTNLYSGAKVDRSELASSTSDSLTISYDLGSGNTKTADFLAISRAKLLKQNGVQGVRVRGASQPATFPSTLSPTLWLDGNRGITSATGYISQWNDLSGNNNHATQSTSAKPLITRSDNKGNYTLYSRTFSNAQWSKNNLTATDNYARNYDGTTTAGRILASVTAAARQWINNSTTSYANIAVGGLSYTVDFYVKYTNYQYVWMGDGGDSVWHGNNVDLQNGTIQNSTNLTSSSITSLGSGWYRVRQTFTRTASGALNFYLYFSLSGATAGTSGTATSAAGTEEFVFGGISSRLAAWDSDDLITTDTPQIGGVNGNKGPHFEGVNDNFTNTLTVNPTSGIWAAVVVKVNTTTGIDNGICSSIGAAQRLRFFVGAGGTIFVRVHNGVDYIGRTTPAGTIVAGTTAVITFTYDGGTASSGIKIYKNGVQVDNADSASGVYTVPTAGAVLVIGELSAGDRFNGYIPEFIYKQGATISDANRQALEAYLTTKYITAPAASVDLVGRTLLGPNSEDYFTTFTETSAYRYWWLEFHGSSTKYPVSKVTFGKALDFGRDPEWSNNKPLILNYSRQTPWSREAAYSANLSFNPVTDTVLGLFLSEIAKYADVIPVAAIDLNQYVFNQTSGMFCSLTDYTTAPRYGAENAINITLEEQI